MRSNRWSLEGKILAASALAVLAGTTIPFALTLLGLNLRLALAGGLLLALLLVVFTLRGITQPMNRALTTLEGGLLNFRDGDFSVSLALKQRDELGDIATLFNEVGEILRRERAHIYQRELLLDTVIQSAPQALVLIDQEQRIIYANHSARHLMNNGKPIQGLKLDNLLPNCPDELARSILSGENGLVSYTDSEGAKTQHLANSQFVLNAHRHRLIVIREMTRELTRAEVQVWKKVIRLISHELNNSLAPISSLAHSGRLLIGAPAGESATQQQVRQQSLEKVFDVIADRCGHLTEFTQGYARFAKLPAPSCETVEWRALIRQLEPLHQFAVVGEPPSRPGYFDPVQVEQALLNLFKNAAEAGSAPEEIEFSIRTDSRGQTLTVRDRGHGMSEKVLQQALLPFYSTKPDGVGLGLALCREIVDAHGGTLQLHNRENGGLQVQLWLPWQPDMPN